MNILNGVLSTDTDIVTANEFLRGDGSVRLNSLTSAINDPFTALNNKNDTVTSLTSNHIAKDGITVDALLASQSKTPIISGKIILF